MSSTRRRRKLLYGWLQELGVGRGLAGPWLGLGGHGVGERAHALGESPELLPLLALQAELDISLVVSVLHPHLQRVQAVLDLHDLAVSLLDLSSEQTNKQHLEEREREMFYLTTHSTHFIYSYMASDIWLRTILIVRKEILFVIWCSSIWIQNKQTNNT